MTTVLVTGGCGFIGSNFIRQMLANHPYDLVNLDKLTYAGNLDNLRDVEDDSRYEFVRGDICDQQFVDALFERLAVRGPLWVINFAAETHVDRSLMDPTDFIRTDVHGVFVLLEAARRVSVERFLQVSTDEVYGDIPPGVSSKEEDRLWPRSPYAASKAGAEMMCWAFRETYGLPILISRASNNVGPFRSSSPTLSTMSRSHSTAMAGRYATGCTLPITARRSICCSTAGARARRTTSAPATNGRTSTSSRRS